MTLDAMLMQAREVSTPAEALRRLSHRGEPPVLEAVAANPNTPPDVLWTLAARFPEAVLDNPGLELLSLEDPLWLQRPPANVVVSLFLHPRAPEWFITQVSSGPIGLRLALASRTQRPDLLWRLARTGSEPNLLARLVANPHAPASLLEHLAVEHPLMEAVLRREQRPAYFVEAALAAGQLQGPTGAHVLAELPHLPAHQIERLATSSDERVRRALARSPHATPELLDRLARDPSLQVRAAVASNARCPKALANYLRQTHPPDARPLPFKP